MYIEVASWDDFPLKSKDIDERLRNQEDTWM